MKFKEMLELSTEDLLKKIKQFSVNQLKNPSRIRVVRKDIARMLTILNARKEVK